MFDWLKAVMEASVTATCMSFFMWMWMRQREQDKERERIMTARIQSTEDFVKGELIKMWQETTKVLTKFAEAVANLPCQWTEHNQPKGT